MRIRGGRRWAVGALVVALCSVGDIAVSADAADKVVTTDVGYSVDAFLGTFAWGEFTASGDDSRLVLFSRGQRRFAPVRLFGTYAGAPEPSLGPNRHGAPVATYSRCSLRADCDIFALDLRSGRERKLRSLSTRRWAEDAIAIWGRRYVFRRYCVRYSRRCRGEGLFVSPPLRRITRKPAEFDLHGRVVAFVQYGDDAARAESLWVAFVSWRGRFRRCLVANARRLKASGLESASVMTSPVVTRRFIYWVAGPTSEAEESGDSFYLRRRIPTGRCAHRGRVEILRRQEFGRVIAVTGGRVFYTYPPVDPSGVLRYSLFEMTDPPVRDP